MPQKIKSKKRTELQDSGRKILKEIEKYAPYPDEPAPELLPPTKLQQEQVAPQRYANDLLLPASTVRLTAGEPILIKGQPAYIPIGN